MSQPYVDGIKDKVSHNFASSLTVDQIAADEDQVTISVVCPDRWFLGDFAVVTSRDGGAFAGEVAGMDICTGFLGRDGELGDGAGGRVDHPDIVGVILGKPEVAVGAGPGRRSGDGRGG